MSETAQKPGPISVGEVVSVGDYAQKLEIPVTRVIAELMKNGVMATINEQIDFDTASIIGAELGFEIVPEARAAEPAEQKVAKGGQARPPIVAVMGHVDHGKTSLLDAIRQTDVVAREAGGITQHIGAYQIKHGERWITFLDTPGHEAFSALRAHGARMTDVAIIVIAADDGVKPQTREAIEHVQRAGSQMVIAINKIDKEGTDANRVKQELSEMELVPEEWGGKTVVVEISAKAGKNIEQLLDMVLLVSDLEDLRAEHKGMARGFIVESHVATGKGPVATVLVQEGTLKPGDYLVIGATYAKVRSLDDFLGRKIKQATPGMPAIISGLKSVPEFGQWFEAVKDEKTARESSTSRQRQDSIKSMVKVKKIGAEELGSAITAGKVKELNVVVKADVQGSLESLTTNLEELRNDEVAVKIISSGVGDVNESDLNFAKTAGAIILGFNVGMSPTVRQQASRDQVKIRVYKVIYELLDDIRDVLGQMLDPEQIEIQEAELEVLGVFKTTKSSIVCGGRVTSGKIVPKQELNIWRKDKKLGTGTLTSLQKEKQTAKEVVEGELCGMEVATTAPIEVGDRLEFVRRETRARKL